MVDDDCYECCARHYHVGIARVAFAVDWSPLRSWWGELLIRLRLRKRPEPGPPFAPEIWDVSRIEVNQPVVFGSLFDRSFEAEMNAGNAIHIEQPTFVGKVEGDG